DRRGRGSARSDRRPERREVVARGRLHAHARHGDPRAATVVGRHSSLRSWRPGSRTLTSVSALGAFGAGPLGPGSLLAGIPGSRTLTSVSALGAFGAGPLGPGPLLAGLPGSRPLTSVSALGAFGAGPLGPGSLLAGIPGSRTLTSSTNLGQDEVDCLTDGRDAFEILFGDLNVEALLQPHHELDQVETVGVEVLF